MAEFKYKTVVNRKEAVKADFGNSATKNNHRLK